ncbi:MAG: hypothetical protein HXX20_14280 [Chloroflexi bacterium]|nr:hypothetical protein [Chloroflexota bacterium]
MSKLEQNMSKLDEILKEYPIKQKFIQLLLACPSIENRASRDNLFKGVRKGKLVTKIARSTVDKTDVENIVNFLLNYSGALEELISFVRLNDAESTPFKALQKFLANLTKIEAVTALEKERKKPSSQAQGKKRAKLDQSVIRKYNLEQIECDFRIGVKLAGIARFVIPSDEKTLKDYILVRLYEKLAENNPNCRQIDFYLYRDRLASHPPDVAIWKELEASGYGNPHSWFGDRSNVLLILWNNNPLDNVPSEKLNSLVYSFDQQLQENLLPKLKDQFSRLVIVCADTQLQSISVDGFSYLNIEKHNQEELGAWFIEKLTDINIPLEQAKILAKRVKYHPNLAGAFREMVKISTELTGRRT